LFASDGEPQKKETASYESYAFLARRNAVSLEKHTYTF